MADELLNLTPDVHAKPVPDDMPASLAGMRKPEEIRYIQAFSRIIGVREEEAMEYAQRKGIRSLVENADQLLSTPVQREKHQAFLDLYRLSSAIGSRNPVIASPLDAAAFFRSVMERIHDQESFAVAYLNTRNRVIDYDVVSIGTINSSMVHPREVFRNAILNKANAIIVCHNHPTGDLTPSPDDHNVTRRLKETGEILGIGVHDHIIIHGVNRDAVYSFRQYGIMEAATPYAVPAGATAHAGQQAIASGGTARDAAGDAVWETSREITSPPKDGVREIVQKLEQGIHDFFDGEKYRAYLRTMARFHRYSVNNTMLIAMQIPDATLVAGFNKWQDQFGRNVKKGEHGIRIIAPAPVKVVKQQERIDPATRKPLRDEQGNVLTEDESVKLPTFRVVSVFDVSQTEGKPLPQLASPLTGDVERYDVLMEALHRVSPVPVVMEPMRDGMDGYFHPGPNIIALRVGMSQTQTVSAAVHEIAHAVLHSRELAVELLSPTSATASEGRNHDGEKAPDPLGRSTEEVQAESVSYAVCAHFGIPTEENSFGYIAAWSQGREVPELKASLEIITRTASKLIDGLENEIGQLQRIRDVERYFDKAFLDGTADGYAIYQIREGAQYRDFWFRSLEDLQADGLAVERSRYMTQYIGELPPMNGATDHTQERLNALFHQFNMERPADFTGHSLSVGDVIAIRQDGVVTTHYVDSFGFTPLPQFLQPANPLRGIEDAVEQNDNQFDGLINNLLSESLESSVPDKPKMPAQIVGVADTVGRTESAVPADAKRPSVRELIRQLAEKRQMAKASLAAEVHAMAIGKGHEAPSAR